MFRKNKQIGALLTVFSVLMPVVGRAQTKVSFGELSNLGPSHNTWANEGVPKERADGLERFMGSDRPGGYGDYDLWVASRATTEDDWSAWVNLGPTINTSGIDTNPSISADGLSLYFASERPGGWGLADIWVATRVSLSDSWLAPRNLGVPVNSSDWDAVPYISPDGLSLYFESERPGGYGSVDVWLARRATLLHAWEIPVNVGPVVNSAASDGAPWLFADGLALLFTSNRGSGWGGYDLWMSTRRRVGQAWGTPVNLGGSINSAAHDGWSSVSADGSMLYVASQRPGGYGNWDAWQAPIIYGPFCGDDEHPYPPGDSNQDCRVDWLDIAIVCSHWLEDNSPQ
jgi:Tol biopolymer transport system component